MCKYVLLKNDGNILTLKLPEVFCAKCDVIRMTDEDTLNDFLNKEFRRDPEMAVTHYTLNYGMERQVSLGEILSLKQGDYYFVHKQQEIRFIKASGSYSEIIFTNHKHLTVTFRLAAVESKLSEKLFIRIHKSFIVNMNYITKFIGNTVYLDTEVFPIGRKFKKEFIMRLNLLGNTGALLKDKGEEEG